MIEKKIKRRSEEKKHVVSDSREGGCFCTEERGVLSALSEKKRGSLYPGVIGMRMHSVC